jgi:hypothetical protein
MLGSHKFGPLLKRSWLVRHQSILINDRVLHGDGERLSMGWK